MALPRINNLRAVNIVISSGGDFADGVIAHEGEWLGAEEFVSFDSKVVSLLQAQGSRARLLS